MALFKRDWNKPGPGVPKNAPKKTGIARFFEIVLRDFSKILKLNLLQILCLLPAQGLFIWALLHWVEGNGTSFIFFAALALAASVMVGPTLTTVYGLLTKMLRDDSGFIWHDFKGTFKSNFRGTVVPGLVYALLMGSQAIAIMIYIMMSGDVPFVILLIYLFAILLINLASPYYFIQARYLELSQLDLIKNSLLFAVAYAPRSLAGMLIAWVLIAAQWAGSYFIPVVSILFILGGVTIPTLVRTMWAWPPIDKTFSIDQTLRNRTSKELDESLEEQGIEVSPKE